MTTSQVQTLIDNIQDAGENTASEVRAILNALKNESCKLYEVKEIDVNLTTTPTYLTENFDVTGLGINDMEGFAICNGGNGTRDRKGKTAIGYDPTNYPTPGATGGVKQVSLAAANIPELDITVPVCNAGGGGGAYTKILASDSGTDDTKTYNDVTGNATPTPVSIMQPYIVTLFIQRIA